MCIERMDQSLLFAQLTYEERLGAGYLYVFLLKGFAIIIGFVGLFSCQSISMPYT